MSKSKTTGKGKKEDHLVEATAVIEPVGDSLSDISNVIGCLGSSQESDAPSISVNLPGGKSVMGQGGVEIKVTSLGSERIL